MSGDSSSFYRIGVRVLNGNTLVPSIPWLAASPSQYRNFSLPEPGELGRLPVAAFTRAASEGGNVDPIAQSGALIIARLPKASNQGGIAVIPKDDTVLTQYQPLTSDPSIVPLWTFPGDSLYIRDPGFNADGGLEYIEFFVRPLNYEEIDTYLALPKRPAGAVTADPVLPLAGMGDVPFVNAKRTIYLVTPPVADTVYILPTPGVVPAGNELVFVGTNNLPFILNPVILNGPNNIPPFYYVPGRGVVTMTSTGGGYAASGSASTRTVTIATGETINPFRGVVTHRFSVAAPEAFAMPATSTVPNDAVFRAINVNAGTVTLSGTGGLINVFANATLAVGEAADFRVSGPDWVGVKS